MYLPDQKTHYKYNNQINIAKAVEKIIKQKDKATRSAFTRTLTQIVTDFKEGNSM